MNRLSFGILICLLLPPLAAFAADAPPAPATPTPAPPAAAAPSPDPAEEQFLERTKAAEAARLEAEVAALRKEANQQLETKIEAAKNASRQRLETDIAYYRARYGEEQAGLISLDPLSPGATRVLRRVDREPTGERVLLLLPEGPLVMQLSLSLDGKPLQTEVEAILDEMLAAADVNQDGQSTWEEALSRAEFKIGSLVYNPERLVGDERAKLLRSIDANGDGLVARAEARLFLAMSSGAGAFNVRTLGSREFAEQYELADGKQGPQPSEKETRSAIEALLDLDGDRNLTRRELLSMSWRLKLRDKNDDDAVEVAELFDLQNRNYFLSSGVNRAAPEVKSLLLALGPLANWEVIWKALNDRYAKDGKLAVNARQMSAAALAPLDKNASGIVEREELSDLNQVPPQIGIVGKLGATDKPAEALQITCNLPGVSAGAADSQAGSHMVALLGAQLVFVRDALKPNWRENLEQRTQQTFNAYDTDKNGYLEEKEFPEEVRNDLARQFKAWDTNGDGKVYLDELREFNIRQQRVRWCVTTAAAMEQPNSLYHAIDTNGDGQLGAREMQVAHQRLAGLDANRNGRITSAEIPPSIRIGFGRSATINQMMQSPSAARSLGMVEGAGTVRSGPGPIWFALMDINGDGDVTPREFLGPVEKFSQIDKNGDRFIDATEATAAGGEQAQAAR